MTSAHGSQPDRRQQARLIQGRQVQRQWRLVLLALVTAASVGVIITLIQRYLHDVEVGILRERSELILVAMRDERVAPSYDHRADTGYLPPSWTITAAEVVGARGRVLATIDNPSAEGLPGTMVWELWFVDEPPHGWTCTAIRTVGAWSDDEGWRK